MVSACWCALLTQVSQLCLSNVSCLRICRRRWMSWTRQYMHCRLALTVWLLSTIPWVHSLVAACWRCGILVLQCYCRQEWYLVFENLLHPLQKLDMPTIPLLAELFRISAVVPPFRTEFVKFPFSIPFIWAIKLGIFIHKSLKNPITRGHLWSSNCTIIKIGWGFAPDPNGGAYSAPTPRSWISIYRPFGPLLSGLYCRPFGPPLWVIPLFGFQMLACMWNRR